MHLVDARLESPPNFVDFADPCRPPGRGRHGAECHFELPRASWDGAELLSGPVAPCRLISPLTLSFSRFLHSACQYEGRPFSSGQHTLCLGLRHPRYRSGTGMREVLVERVADLLSPTAGWLRRADFEGLQVS